MAEIRIEGRHHRVWPWLLALLLLLLLVWALAIQAGRRAPGGSPDVRDDGTRLGATPAPPERSAPSAVDHKSRESRESPDSRDSEAERPDRREEEAQRVRMRMMA